MADVVLAQRVDDAGLAGRVTVTSCGTGDWHVGQPMDERAAAILRANDYDPSEHRAQQFSAPWLAAQRPRPRDGRGQPRGGTPRRRRGRVDSPSRAGSGSSATSTPSNRVARCRTRTTVGQQGFEEVLAMVERTCAALVSALQQLPDLIEPPT